MRAGCVMHLARFLSLSRFVRATKVSSFVWGTFCPAFTFYYLCHLRNISRIFALLLPAIFIACASTNTNTDKKMSVINSNIQVHARFSGKVQGVYFRKTTQLKARELGLTGWVKNLADGRVEMIAEGSPEKVKELITELHQKFLISNFEREDGTPSKRFSGFEILF